MKAIVIYKSRTGFTKRYAELIGSALECEIYDYNEIGSVELSEFDLVIFGSRVHAGRIDSVDKIRKLLENGKCDLIIFATGATPAAAKDEIEKTRANSLGDSGIPFFYMQSGLCYEKMGLADKAIMKMLSAFLSRKGNKSETENGAASAIASSYDISDGKYITPLVDFVKEKYKGA
ncbi:MAG: flavodoxin domain-containing protein [Eubacteriales bacterium]|nr:flavodoxin domain-containing protein [Eubacteriales bacterium]MDD3882048.1 flavodoxin domain-containing protein [Eubacteriales bacterium]MDD4512495.1 flavodoxin domain-containing protein [Eubacteriales bacterium]